MNNLVVVTVVVVVVAVCSVLHKVTEDRLVIFQSYTVEAERWFSIYMYY